MFEIASFDQLAYGLITGLAFGFLLQRGGVTRYSTIVGQFLWKDHTVLRTMLTAVVVGSIGVYAMHLNPATFGEIKLHVKDAAVLANVLGGVIFGVGMVVLGYCPGTGIAALGDGSRHAVFGILGMLAGSAAYAEAYPWMKTNVLSVGNLGKVTLPEILGVSPWVLIIALAAVAALVFGLLRKTGVPTVRSEKDNQDVPGAKPVA